MTLYFSQRGHRIKPDGGLTYRCFNGPYLVYKGDQCGGVRLKPVRYHAIYITEQGQRLLSRHRTKGGAEGACRVHAKESAQSAEKTASRRGRG